MTRGRVVFAVAAALVIGVGVWLVVRSGAEEGGRPAPEVADRTAAVTAGGRGPAPAAVPIDTGPITLSPATVIAAPEATSGELAGRVLDWGTGAPVPGAEVAIAPDGGGATSSFTTDAQGRFVVRPPAVGRYRVVSALAAGYLPWAPDPDASPLELVARAGVRVDGVVLYLVPAVTYRGWVVDPDGKPVAGATVVLLDAARGERAQAPIEDTFTSGADGGFAFHAPDDALLEARAEGFAPGRARVDAAVAISREVTIRLGARGGAAPPELAIAGIVVDARGEPVAGARVVAIPAGNELRRGGEATAGDDGRFAVDGLDAGAYGVRAFARGHASATAFADAGARDVRIELGEAARIAGRVVDPGGAAVPAATVAVVAAQGMNRRVVAVASVFDAEGRFVVEDIAAGDYLVIAQAHGHAPSAETPATAAADPAEVTVTVRRGGVLVGKVVDATTTAPLESGKVTVEGALGEGASAVPLTTTAITRADGGFELAGIAPGRRSVTAGAADHHMQIVGPFDVAEGARIGPVTIELTPTAPGETPMIELAGIGAVLSIDGDALRIDRVVEGGGAARAGLVAGDHVLAVDGTPVVELGLDGAIQRIRGPVGTTVLLRVQRGDSSEDVPVRREKIRA